MARGTANAVFRPMAILLISWVSASMVCCLAFLSVAARPVPRMNEKMASGSATTLRQELAGVLENVKTASPLAQATLPSPCHAA